MRDNSIWDQLLHDMTMLKDVRIPEGIQIVGNRWFSSSGIESVTIPASVREIEDEAFWKCKSLK